MSTKPRLYNWVRVIRKISLISACYSALIVFACLCWGVYIRLNQQPAQTDLSFNGINLFAGILSTILFTVGLRKIGVRKLQEFFRSNHSFEFVLGFWCLTLLLIHLECQLLALALANLSFMPLVDLLLFIVSVSVITLSWPRLNKIQKLLQ